MDSGESIGASSSRQLAKAAREEVQPFFTARIYAPDADREALQALRISVQGQLRDFLATPRPYGAQGYVFYRSEPVVAVSQGAVQISLATGGATEDEFLLLHFLRLQQRPGGLLRQCAIQVVDEDGQFLLIEAADHIPDWISPENADGRVWLYQEEVKILPLETPADLASSLQGLYHHTPASSRSLNDAAFSRMSTYPSTQWTEALRHRTAVILPSLSVAKALQACPQLIARAGQAFLGRDARDARLASKMTKFLAQPVDDTSSPATPIAIIITLPRRLYTHLLSARFHPPKIFPTPYHEHVSAFWTALDSLTTPEGAANESEETRQRRAASLQVSRRWDLGCKLAVGMEIAFANDSERNRRRRRHDVFAARPAQSDSARDHEKFLSRLESFGYFEGEMRGSKRWKELEAKAVEEWGREAQPRTATSSPLPDEGDDGDEAHTSWTQDSSLFDSSSATSSPDTLSPSDLAALSAQEQDDSWLYEVGETFLDDASGGPTSEEEQAQQKLSEFAAQMERFVEGKGDVEGALIDEDDSDEEEGESSEDEEGARGSAKERLAKMTEEEKAEHLQKLLPGLKDKVEWSRPSGDQDRDRMEEDLRAVLEESQHTDPPVASASASTPTPSAARKPPGTTASQRPLSKDELRRSFASSAKALRSGSGNIEGGESWGLEADSDDDAEVDEDGNALPQLGENGEPETKETRRQRALMLGLDPSDDEDEGEPQGGKGAKNVPTLEEDVADEMDEFVDFASKELGLSKKQLDGIMEQRRSEGRWVPGKEQAKEQPQQQQNANGQAASPIPTGPASSKAAAAVPPSSFGKGFGKGFLNKKATPLAAAKSAAAATTPQASSLKKYSDAGTDGISSSRDDKPTKRVAFSSDTAGGNKDVPTPTAPVPAAAPSQPTTTTASSPFSAFDALLSALDTRLNEHRASKGLPPLTEAELQNAPVRGEDWNLRRPGGASLGSVMAKEAKDQKEKGGQATVGETATTVPTETQPQPQPSSADAMEDVQAEAPTAEDDEDEDEDEEMLPLSARDPALLERRLAEQDAQPPSFKEMVAQLDEERAARRAQQQAPSDQGSSDAARIVELPPSSSSSSNPASKPPSSGPSEMPGLEDSDEESVESAESDEEMFPTIVADGAEDGEGGAMADLLESWRAQGGRPGPVGNLVGGMGLRGQAPR